MQQTSHTGTLDAHKPQKGAMMKLWQRPVLRRPALGLTAEVFDGRLRPGDRGKPLRAAGEAFLERITTKVWDIVKPAAGPAGDLPAHLAEIDGRRWGAWLLRRI